MINKISPNFPNDKWLTIHLSKDEDRRIRKDTYVKAQEVYNYICSFYIKNNVHPTYREIKREFSFSSLSSVAHIVEILIDLKLVRKPEGKSRSIVIVGAQSLVQGNEIGFVATADAVPTETADDVLLSVKKTITRHVPSRSKFQTAIGIALRHDDISRAVDLLVKSIQVSADG